MGARRALLLGRDTQASREGQQRLLLPPLVVGRRSERARSVTISSNLRFMFHRKSLS